MKAMVFWWKAMTDLRASEGKGGRSAWRGRQFRLQQSGASTVEYLVATIVVVAMLFLPVPGYSESVMEMMVQGFKDSHHHYVWGMSYPL